MSYHSFPDRRVKTRKRKRCYYCSDIIEIGTVVLKESGVLPGEGFFNGHVCSTCESFKNSPYYDYYDHADDYYGISEGSFVYSDKYQQFKNS